MKITDLELFRVEPRWLFLKITTDSGLSGWGEPIIPGHAETVATAVRELGDWLIGRDPDQIEDIWQLVYRGGFFRGGPILMAALAGVDQALWDIKGHRYGLPAYQFLGGRVRDRLQVYAWLDGDTPAALAQSAREKVAAGYTAIKMDGPRGGQLHLVDTFAQVEAILARVAAVRAAIGSAIGLAVDFHGVAHRAMAKVLAKELEPYHLLFIEEPVLPENNQALREVAAHTTIPIATGERMYSRWEFKQLLMEGVADIIQPDVSHAGGLSEVRRIAAMAEAFDVAVAPHCPLGPIAFMTCLQLGATTPNVFIQEQVLDVHAVTTSPWLRYVQDPTVIEFENGSVAVPKGAGLGLTINEDVVREAATRAPHWRVPLFRNADGTVSEW